MVKVIVKSKRDLFELGGVMLGLFILLTVGFFSYTTINRFYYADQLENSAYNNIIIIEKLFSYLKDAETARRGYILTQEGRFLETYQEALPEIEKRQIELRNIAFGSTGQKNQAAQIDRFIDEKQEILRLSIASVEKQGYDKDIQLAFTDQGKDVMDLIRTLMNEIIDREESNLAALSDQNIEGKKSAAWVIGIGFGVSFTLLIAVFFLLYREMAVRERTEIGLRKSEDSLKSALKTKSNFTSMVSHELRTPLNAINEGIAIVLDGITGKINDEQKDFLQTAKRNVERLGRLINDVLDFQKMDSGKIKLTFKLNGINGIVNEIIKTISPLAKNKNINLAFELDDKLPLINCDRDKITQVIMNLANNAFKFTENGRVTISTRHQAAEIQVAVADTGPGIESSDIPRLFQAFEQLDAVMERKTGGTGLGLAICRQIVEKHGGKIWVESKIGQGSTFIFTLPIKQ